MKQSIVDCFTFCLQFLFQPVHRFQSGQYFPFFSFGSPVFTVLVGADGFLRILSSEDDIVQDGCGMDLSQTSDRI